MQHSLWVHRSIHPCPFHSIPLIINRRFFLAQFIFFISIYCCIVSALPGVAALKVERHAASYIYYIHMYGKQSMMQEWWPSTHVNVLMTDARIQFYVLTTCSACTFTNELSTTVDVLLWIVPEECCWWSRLWSEHHWFHHVCRESQLLCISVNLATRHCIRTNLFKISFSTS